MKKTLLSDDRADQEGDEHHDRNCQPSDLVELIDGRRQPEGTRMAQHTKQGYSDGTEHLQKTCALRDGPAPDSLQEIQDEAVSPLSGRLAAIDASHLPHETSVGFGDTGQAHVNRCRGTLPRKF